MDIQTFIDNYQGDILRQSGITDRLLVFRYAIGRIKEDARLPV